MNRASDQIQMFSRHLMSGGVGSKAGTILRAALDRAHRKLRGAVPQEQILAVAIANAKPIIEIRTRRIGGTKYQVPMQVPIRRQEMLAIRWLVHAARKASGRTIEARLAKVILGAYMNQMPWGMPRIVSGGQTGADRGGLDAAIELDVPHGGWCPRGRLAEDGVVPGRYKLRETKSAEYRDRTERNVKGADGTVVFSRGPLEGGSALTVNLARKYKKPLLHLDLSSSNEREAEDALVAWLIDNSVAILNVAGSRESKARGIQVAVMKIVSRAMRRAYLNP